jgi:hypothetical protein
VACSGTALALAYNSCLFGTSRIRSRGVNHSMTTFDFLTGRFLVAIRKICSVNERKVKHFNILIDIPFQCTDLDVTVILNGFCNVGWTDAITDQSLCSFCVNSSSIPF